MEVTCELRVIGPASRAGFEAAAGAPPAKGATVLVIIIELVMSGVSGERGRDC